jgi:hypothetical protein
MASRRQRSSPTAGSDDLRAPLLNVCFSLLPSASLRRREDLATHLTIRNYSLKPALAEALKKANAKNFWPKSWYPGMILCGATNVLMILSTAST